MTPGTRGTRFESPVSSDWCQRLFQTAGNIEIIKNGAYGLISKILVREEIKVTLNSLPSLRVPGTFAMCLTRILHSCRKASARACIVELGAWLSDLNKWNKIRDCPLEDSKEVAEAMKPTFNLTGDQILKTFHYSMEDIYVTWTFADIERPDQKKFEIFHLFMASSPTPGGTGSLIGRCVCNVMSPNLVLILLKRTARLIGTTYE